MTTDQDKSDKDSRRATSNIVAQLQTSLAALHGAEEKLNFVSRRIYGGKTVDATMDKENIQGQPVTQMVESIHNIAHRIMEAAEKLGDCV